jgi:hypothetical protein
MELKMKPVIEKVGKLLITLLIFVFLFRATFLVLPYAARQTYTDSSRVNEEFPIAILDHGKPDIVDWYRYQRNADLYKDKIISAPTQKEYKLSEHEFFWLTPGPNNVLNLYILDGDWNHYWAEYSVSNGIVKPISYRCAGDSLAIICFAVALVGTLMIGWLYKCSVTSRST